MANVDISLLEENKRIESELLNVAEKLYIQKDSRWFFSYSHGKITQSINQNINKFDDPNGLIKFNMHFAKAYLRAINGKPPKEWQDAFNQCNPTFTMNVYTVQNYKISPMQLRMNIPVPTEYCAFHMANVHINVDLANALKEVKCISKNDYGNMLELVNRGADEATSRLRSKSNLGIAEAWLTRNLPFVKYWRNEAYKNICLQDVPEVTLDFIKSLSENRVNVKKGNPTTINRRQP